MPNRLPVPPWMTALGGLLLVCAPVAGEESPNALPSELAVIPPDAGGFLTVRTATLAGKLGLDGKSGSLPEFYHAAWQEAFGLPFRNVERCTVVMVPGAKEAPDFCIVFRTVKAYRPKEVLEAWVSKARKVRTEDGKDIHVGDDGAAHFASERVFLLARSEAALRRCLKEPADRSRTPKALAEAVALAPKNDVVAWGRRSALWVDSWPVPAPPAGVESAAAALEVSDELTVRLSVNCTDDTGTRWAARALPVGRDMLRAQLLMALNLRRICDLYSETPGGERMKDSFLTIPEGPCRRTEEALRDTQIKTAGKCVHATVTIPVDAGTLRAELLHLIPLPQAICEGMGRQTDMPELGKYRMGWSNRRARPFPR